MASQHQPPTPQEIAAADAAAVESAPMPWSQPPYYNVAVDPRPNHAIQQENRVGVARHAPGLYHSDYGPIDTPIEGWQGSKGRASGG